jgi:hypothetical protein
VSRETVRQAVFTYLSGKSIQNVLFYPAMPKQSDPVPNTSAPTTAISFPVVGNQREDRLGMGKKQITYTVTLEIACFSTQSKGEDAQQDCDVIFEAILDIIRADPTLGTNGSSNPVFQAGEGDGIGSPDLNLRQDLPILASDGSGVHIWAHLDITALEIINA